VIFDFDGTLADTVPVCCAAFRAAVRRHTGREFSDAEIVARFGPSEEGIIRDLVGDGWERCLAAYLDAYEHEHAACPAAFDGLAALLDDLRRRGVRLGLVTGKGARSAAISLRLLALDGTFDAVETGSPNGAVKPAALRRIARGWAVAPSRVAYVGDAPSDIHDARDAGLVPLAAAWAPAADRAALLAARPRATFTSVDQLATWIEQQVSG
jgi:phosphoglycolate phosphatase/pyrophosphatase PpaX